jgi:hypothetical protein
VLLAVAVVVVLIVAWLCRREQAQRTMFQGTARVLWAGNDPDDVGGGQRGRGHEQEEEGEQAKFGEV